MYALETEIVENANRKLTIEIHPDENPGNPREEWDNLGILFADHRRYDLGDSEKILGFQKSSFREAFESWSEIEEHLEGYHGALYALPVYMMDHGSVALSTSSYACKWDSGRVGVIYTTTENLMKIMGTTDVTEERVHEILRGEIDTYSSYLNGDVYGYVIKDEDGEQLDSCWGFIGDEDKSGLWEEARASAKYYLEKERPFRLTGENAVATMRNMASILWPDGHHNAPWSADTVDAIAEQLRKAGLAPKNV